jgi:hypothetical protein
MYLYSSSSSPDERCRQIGAPCPLLMFSHSARIACVGTEVAVLPACWFPIANKFNKALGRQHARFRWVDGYEWDIK